MNKKILKYAALAAPVVAGFVIYVVAAAAGWSPAGAASAGSMMGLAGSAYLLGGVGRLQLCLSLQLTTAAVAAATAFVRTDLLLTVFQIAGLCGVLSGLGEFHDRLRSVVGGRDAAKTMQSAALGVGAGALVIFMSAQLAFLGRLPSPRGQWIACLCVCVPLVLLSEYVVFSGKVFRLFSRSEYECIQLINSMTSKCSPEESRMGSLYARLLKIMEEEKPFLKEGFTMDDLCRQVGTNRSYLSRTLNIYAGRNYCQFVNLYKVKYSIGLMRENPRMRIVDLAMASGFHSSVSYNMAFRMNVGQTPAEYRNNLPFMTDGSDDSLPGGG